ncbi:MAG: co-chaperone GroES [Chlamydiia bacterium]|nr:co-chaperone GroES [Chlamydiia bacterium]
MTKFKPLGNRVLVKRAQAATSKGGILLPETAQEKPREGVVLSVGPGKEDKSGKVQPLSVKEGDRILFSSYAGTEVKSPDSEDELLILAEDDILGILTN